MNGWVRVTRKEPCRVCKKPDWCDWHPTIGICCMRVQSDKPMKNGGWWHPLDSTASKIVPVKREEPPHINATAIMRGFWKETTPEMVQGLGMELGVSESALIEIGAGWAEQYNAWAFPMHDAYRNIIGIRLRDHTGRKWAVTGSRAGLFYGRSAIAGLVAVCEGPTDTAAALTVGLCAIGRPSCLGQENLLCDLLRKANRVLIVSDNDTPGINGAERLQGMLRCPSLVWCPPCKDLRAFVMAGGDVVTINCLTKHLVWHQPHMRQAANGKEV